MMGGNWSINGVETHAICVGAGSNKEQEAKEERYESRNKQNWIREEQSIRGRIRHIFRDAKTGRFIKRPKK